MISSLQNQRVVVKAAMARSMKRAKEPIARSELCGSKRDKREAEREAETQRQRQGDRERGRDTEAETGRQRSGKEGLLPGPVDSALSAKTKKTIMTTKRSCVSMAEVPINKPTISDDALP
jgi:hypothetical protein